MPILTTIRQSPAYLYVKTYCLCAIVSLFQAAPVSSRLPKIKERPRLDKNRNIATRQKFSIPLPDDYKAFLAPQIGKGSSIVNRITSHELVWPEISSLPSRRHTPPGKILKRWFQRAVDLAQVKNLLRQDDNDLRTYPELQWDAKVRRSTSLNPEEERFIQIRRNRISSEGVNSLHHFLGLPEDEHVDPRDVPLIALGGSGGGYRAMYGFAAFISASKKLGFWDCLTWTAGVSGSCWTLAAYYTIANHDIFRLIKHYLSVAQELAHPMSLSAFDTVVRSSKGVYFLIGPLIRKVRSGIIGLGIMDLFGTMTTTYHLLSREPSARLSRATFQFSKVWIRSGIHKGLEPMPFLTAVRRAPNASGVKPHADSSLSKGQPPKRALTQHQTKVPDVITGLQRQKLQYVSLNPAVPQNPARVDPPDSSLLNGFFQWFEISPLEVGSADVQGYIPTWSWGRSFVSGHSVGRPPEQSLSLLLGQCTSAPAGPLTGYISALLATIPKGTVMSRLLLLLNDFVRMKNWQGLWGNPIRAGHDPNPFYGHNNGSPPQIGHEDGSLSTCLSLVKKNAASGRRWENQGRISLMDSGMSNNLPSHIFARPERGTDIIIAFDASSDVHRGSAIQRIQNFADDCGLDLEEQTDMFDSPEPRFRADADGAISAGMKVESKFLSQYTRVFRGRRENGKELYLIYCPLLPNGWNPEFDPSTASFSTSYNLVWTPAQIQTLFSTCEANLSDYTIKTIKRVVKKVYDAKKSHRLALPLPRII